MCGGLGALGVVVLWSGWGVRPLLFIVQFHIFLLFVRCDVIGAKVLMLLFIGVVGFAIVLLRSGSSGFRRRLVGFLFFGVLGVGDALVTLLAVLVCGYFFWWLPPLDWWGGLLFVNSLPLTVDLETTFLWMRNYVRHSLQIRLGVIVIGECFSPSLEIGSVGQFLWLSGAVFPVMVLSNLFVAVLFFAGMQSVVSVSKNSPPRTNTRQIATKWLLCVLTCTL